MRDHRRGKINYSRTDKINTKQKIKKIAAYEKEKRECQHYDRANAADFSEKDQRNPWTRQKNLFAEEPKNIGFFRAAADTNRLDDRQYLNRLGIRIKKFNAEN